LNLQPNKKEVGTRIKMIRNSKGETQEEFGNHFEAHKSIISKWENGTSLPSSERLSILSDISGMPVEQILYGDNYHTTLEMYEYLITEYKSYIGLFQSMLGSFINREAFERANNYAQNFISRFKSYSFQDYKLENQNENKIVTPKDYQSYKEDISEKLINKFKEIYDISKISDNNERQDQDSAKKDLRLFIEQNTNIVKLQEKLYSALIDKRKTNDDIEFYESLKPSFKNLKQEVNKIINDIN